jgi:hypothetical protein
LRKYAGKSARAGRRRVDFPVIYPDRRESSLLRTASSARESLILVNYRENIEKPSFCGRFSLCFVFETEQRAFSNGQNFELLPVFL